MSDKTARLKLGWREADKFITAVYSQKRVTGLTHDFYKYPARFSPQFCRAAIDVFSNPGDLITDPFAGGGTSLVESRVAGRLSVGTDISSLANFVSRVKTRIYSHADLAYFEKWFKNVDEKLCQETVSRHAAWREAGYFRNLTTPQTWHIRKTLEAGVTRAGRIQYTKREEFVRCVLLRAAQWALDGRREIPTLAAFRYRVTIVAGKMIDGARLFSLQACRADRAIGADSKTRTVCLHRRAEELADYIEKTRRAAPRLVITSPPYPGVHIVYHRWQIHGGRETPAPFWVANQLDGSGESFYLMHARSNELKRYHQGIAKAFSATSRIVDTNSIVVQMVAFSNPKDQLPRYLDVMEEAGYKEYLLSEHIDSKDGRLWRDVPGRKWHANSKGQLASGKEVVLIHRPA